MEGPEARPCSDHCQDARLGEANEEARHSERPLGMDAGWEIARHEIDGVAGAETLAQALARRRRCTRSERLAINGRVILGYREKI